MKRDSYSLEIKVKTFRFLRNLAIALIITLGASQARAGQTIQFPDYVPIDPAGYGVRTFEWTYGQTGQYTSEIIGTETVPYTSGPITGVKVSNVSTGQTGIGYNDGETVKLLGSSDYYFSTDCSLTAHPSGWSFSTLEDGMVIDQGVYYEVKTDLSDCEMKAQMILIDIQDVTVLHGTYQDAVIWWILDIDWEFTPLNFYGKEFDLGITLPANSDTDGYSVTGFDIYGFGIGLIAEGDIEASTGSLNDLSELKEIALISETAVDIDPDTLNLKSKGRWITCYIELPESYDVDDIDVGSILLEYLLEVQHSDVQDDVLMVKFDSQDVMAYIELVLEIELPADVTLMVTGELTDGTPFEGNDTIRVIDEGGEE